MAVADDTVVPALGRLPDQISGIQLPGAAIGLDKADESPGNTIALDLHLPVMDDPSALAANGVLYTFPGCSGTGKASPTANFDAAETTGSKPMTTDASRDTTHPD